MKLQVCYKVAIKQKIPDWNCYSLKSQPKLAFIFFGKKEGFFKVNMVL